MTTAQLLFSIALGFVSLIIVAFSVYVFWTTMWSDRWSARSNGKAPNAERP